MTFQVEASFLIWGPFWKGWLLVQGCLYHFCPNKRLWLKSVTKKWVIFGQHAPRHQSKMISKHRDLGTCIFGHPGVLIGLKLQQVLMHTKLPIISFFQKLIIFCYLIFEKFEKAFLNQEFYGQLPEHAWSRGFFDFSKSCPLGHHPFFFTQMIP